MPVALSIKSERADQLARDLASLTGESITDAVVAALEARLAVERRRRRRVDLSDIVEPDDILGYDEHGLPV